LAPEQLDHDEGNNRDGVDGEGGRFGELEDENIVDGSRDRLQRSIDSNDDGDLLHQGVLIKQKQLYNSAQERGHGAQG
jgi:hypothetical protein